MSGQERIPHRPETWPTDADGFESNLCTVCGTPTRYGSRHTQCAPGYVKPEPNPSVSRQERDILKCDRMCMHTGNCSGACKNPLEKQSGQDHDERHKREGLRAGFNAAIDFAIEQGLEARDFLSAWREGDTSEWPEFLAARSVQPAAEPVAEYLRGVEEGRRLERAEWLEADDMLTEAAQPPYDTAPQPAAPVVPQGLDLAVIGRRHFGNPIPREWYAAAKDLLGPHAPAGGPVNGGGRSPGVVDGE